MRKIFLFMMLSLDGYFEGPNHDLSWHNVDEEFNEFAISQLNEADTILMGRRTYQLMEDFWPTEDARKTDPEVSEKLNFTAKIVVSKTLKEVREQEYWKNVTLIKENIKEELERLKKQKGKDVIVLASSNLCTTLLELGLLDEIRIMINPVIIGRGTPLFDGLGKKIKLNLTKTREFKSGNVLLYYQPLY